MHELALFIAFFEKVPIGFLNRLQAIKENSFVQGHHLCHKRLDCLATLRLGPRSGVSVTTYSLDTDAGMFAEQVIACLKTAGINTINQVSSVMPLGGFSIGIHVSGANQKLVETLAIALAKTGQAVAPPNTAQGGMAGMALGGTNSADASILIGAKPLQKIQ